MTDESLADIARVYQDRMQMHDFALTVNEKHLRMVNNLKLYKCASNVEAIISPEAYKSIDCNACKFTCDTLKIELLIREKISHTNTIELERRKDNFGIVIHLEEYMTLIGYSNDEIGNYAKRARVKANIRISLTLLQYTQFHTKNAGHMIRFRILCNFEEGKTGSNFKITVAPEYLQFIISSCRHYKNGKISKGMLTSFSRKIYMLDDVNLILIMYYLEKRYSMKVNRNNKLHNRITLGTLAEFLILPATINEVKEAHSTNYFREMIFPVLKALDKLSAKGYITYKLYEAISGKEVTDDRLIVLKRNPEYCRELVVRYSCKNLLSLDQ